MLLGKSVSAAPGVSLSASVKQVPVSAIQTTRFPISAKPVASSPRTAHALPRETGWVDNATVANVAINGAKVPPKVDDIGAAEDAALLAAMAKKVKTMDPTGAEVVDPANCQGVHVVRQDPKLAVVPNFLTNAEVEHLLKLAEPKWQKSQVFTSGVRGAMYQPKARNSALRTNYGAPLAYAETPMLAAIEKKVSQLAGMDVNHLERLILVRYEEGQQYKMHHDGHWRPITVFIYLNDVPDNAEGETFFPNLDLKVKPRKGCAVMWTNTCGKHPDGSLIEDSRVMHAGLPPKGSVKYGVNCFFNMAPKRLEKEEGGLLSGQGPPATQVGRRMSPSREVSIATSPMLGVRVSSPPATSRTLNRNVAVTTRQETRVGSVAALPSTRAAFTNSSVSKIRQVPHASLNQNNPLFQPRSMLQSPSHVRCGSPVRLVGAFTPQVIA